MRGFPKNLNTKFDYEYVVANYTDTAENKAKTIRALQNLLDSVNGWFFVSHLTSADAGTTDDTHKVVEVTENGSSEVTGYDQYEYRENPNAKIFRIGYTVAEVEALIARVSA